MSLAPEPVEWSVNYRVDMQSVITISSFSFDGFELIENCKGGFYGVPEDDALGKNLIEDRFEKLAIEWKTTRRKGTGVRGMALEAPYQKIIAMGEDAIPQILKSLAEEPDHWFWALHMISDENPVPAEAEGNIKKMTEAWLAWGRKNRFIE